MFEPTLVPVSLLKKKKKSLYNLYNFTFRSSSYNGRIEIARELFEGFSTYSFLW